MAALGLVVQKLAEKKHGGGIPYKDSKLTRYLQRGLEGNCRLGTRRCVSKR